MLKCALLSIKKILSVKVENKLNANATEFKPNQSNPALQFKSTQLNPAKSTVRNNANTFTPPSQTTVFHHKSNTFEPRTSLHPNAPDFELPAAIRQSEPEPSLGSYQPNPNHMTGFQHHFEQKQHSRFSARNQHHPSIQGNDFY